MTLYQILTSTIDSFTQSCTEQEALYGCRYEGVRGMIDGALYARDNTGMTIEAAECEV